MKVIQYIDKKIHTNYNNNWDDTLFIEKILGKLKKEWVILDIGAGAGILHQMNFKGLVKEVYGVDPDPRVATNAFLDKSYVGLGDNMSFFEDGKFDLIFCDNVFEHVNNPNQFLNEVNRVLTKGGVFMAKTPNKFHYMPLIAQLTPTWFHKFYNRIRGRDEEDTFPTLYKLNSVKDQKRHATIAEFEVVETKSIEGRPEYLRITWITYLLGMMYEKFVNQLGINSMKVLLISTWRKK